MAVIRWVELRVRVDKNRTRCHILCDHCHKTWHIRDMWQGGDNVSRRSLGKWLQNKIWTLFSTNWRVGTLLWNWVTQASRVSLCHNKTLLCLGLREGAQCPSSDLGMAPVPEITGSWLPIQSRVSMSAPVGQNGAILIWYSMEQFLCGFWKQNYFSILTLHSLRIITALPQSWLHSLCCIKNQVEKRDWNWN